MIEPTYADAHTHFYPDENHFEPCWGGDGCPDDEPPVHFGARAVNIRDCPKGWESNPQYVYIGRAGHGLSGYFGNPIRLARESDRDAVLVQYRAWFKQRWSSDPEFRNAIHLLPPDARLVCFCAPKACHGDVIAQVINHFAQKGA